MPVDTAPTPPAYVSELRPARRGTPLQSMISRDYQEIQDNWLAVHTQSATGNDRADEQTTRQDEGEAPGVAEGSVEPAASLGLDDVLVSAPAQLREMFEGGGQSLASRSQQGWLRTAIEKLSRLGELPMNWDSYGAEPPNAVARERAENALRILYRLNSEPSRLAASAEGGVTVSFFLGRKYGDIEFFNNGEILGLTSAGTGTPEVWDVPSDPAALTAALERIRDFVRSK